MTALPLIIIGCGGFGREVYSIAEAIQCAGGECTIAGFVDDQPTDQDIERVSELGSRVLGPINILPGLESTRSIIAIASASARAGIADMLKTSNIAWATLIHPQSSIGRQVRIGEGSIIAAGARLSTNIALGRHVHIDQNATIGHDSEIGDFSRLNPQACVSGSVKIGHKTLIGAGATILQNLTVGGSSVVGAMACVVRNVADETTVKGVPAG